MKALLPAFALAMSVNQKPISKYEQRPTPSQPTNMRGSELPSTRMSMENMKRFR
ncbi:hypothetical protein D3C85_1939430 [compost metagenome]